MLDEIKDSLKRLRSRIDYDKTDLGEKGEFIKLEYLNNFLDDFETRTTKKGEKMKFEKVINELLNYPDKEFETTNSFGQTFKLFRKGDELKGLNVSINHPFTLGNIRNFDSAFGFLEDEFTEIGEEKPKEESVEELFPELKESTVRMTTYHLEYPNDDRRMCTLKTNSKWLCKWIEDEKRYGNEFVHTSEIEKHCQSNQRVRDVVEKITTEQQRLIETKMLHNNAYPNGILQGALKVLKELGLEK